MDTIHSIGRRKASVARIYLKKGKGNITVNGKDLKDYFPVSTMQYKIEQPFKILNIDKKFDLDSFDKSLKNIPINIYIKPLLNLLKI